MPPQILSWLRETGKLTLGYLGVGLCFVVAGLLNFVLRMVGSPGRGSIILPLAFGFSLAYFFWKWFGRTKLFRPRATATLERPTETNSNNIPILATAPGLATAVLAATYIVSFSGAAQRTEVVRLSFESSIRATGGAPFLHEIRI